MSEYGGKFDSLAKRWQALEREHDEVHPDRSECGGVGACPMMRHANDLKSRMIDALNEWRVR